MRLFWIVIAMLAAAVAVLVFASERDQPGSNGRAVIDDRVPPSPAISHTAPQSTSTSISSPKAAALVDDLLTSAITTDSSTSIDAALNDDGIGSRSTSAEGGGDDGDAATAFDPANPVDGKYIVAGTGTADDPFEITWDLLLQASQTYQPRLGREEVPPQVQAIDGKHIKIAGYFAFPLASTDAREVLVMLNMWDGCCIGVPPSPFDAIEVRLKAPMSGARKQFVNYGTLSGTIQVDPYVQNGWLLGMYLMEDGELEIGM